MRECVLRARTTMREAAKVVLAALRERVGVSEDKPTLREIMATWTPNMSTEDVKQRLLDEAKSDADRQGLLSTWAEIEAQATP